MGKFIIIAGLLLVLFGAVVTVAEFLTGGRGGFLPGDITIRRGSFTLYFPVVTCIVLSLLLTVLAYLFVGGRR